MSNEKTLETVTLVSSMEERAVQYESLKEQFIALKNAFQKIVDLDGFRGKGAESIKAFYSGQIDVVDAWISLFDMQIAFFKGIPGMTEDVDLAENTVVHVPFLENDLENAHRLSDELVTAQQDALSSIFGRINDIVSLDVFSRQAFDGQLSSANLKRDDTIANVINFDDGLVQEYATSESQENVMVGLFSELLNATMQGGEISPIHFDAEAYRSSDVYGVKEEAKEMASAYVTYKAEQNEQRELQREMEELANRPWYEKAWDTVSTFTGEVTGYYDVKRAATGIDPVTGEELSEAERVTAGAFAAAGFIPFVGWAGRAAKGGNAVYKTAKGIDGANNALQAYKGAKSFDYIRKADYGIYGLASANGFGEYITGKDIFGNELSEEDRNAGLESAMMLIGGIGGARVLRGVSSDVGVVSKGISKGEQEDYFIGTLKGNKVHLKGVKVEEIIYTKRLPEVTAKLRKEFNSSIRKNYLKEFANSPESVEYLRKAGLGEGDIARMRDGLNPKGWQVHHNLPLDDGGTNDFTNLVLIKNDPYHKAITNEQISLTRGLAPKQSKTINWPIIEDNIYPQTPFKRKEE